MNWLHLSDIHFNPEGDSGESTYLRSQLSEFLKKKNFQVDKIIITGDLRDASCQDDSEESAKEVVKYIKGIAKDVGVERIDNIILVPGNHDLSRNYDGRQEIICNNKRDYRSNEGDFNKLDVLVDSFVFYKRVLMEIYGEDETNNLFENVYKINPHKYNMFKHVNVLQMNTELLAGEIVTDSLGNERVNDEGSLVVGSKYIINALMNLKHNNKPVIVVGHRGLEQLNSEEKRKILKLFKDYNVCLYLCGHSHDLWCDETYEIPHVTVGCIKQANGVKAGFSYGVVDENENSITINAYSWDNNCWSEYSHFSKFGNTLKIDLEDKILIDDEFDNKIKIIIDGRVRNFNCKVDDINFGVEKSQYISVVSGDLKCTLRNNSYSRYIKMGHTFILSDDVWKIIGVDKTKKSVTILTCQREFKGADDDFESGIAKTKSISNFAIEMVAKIKDIGISQEIVVKPIIFKDQKHFEADLILKSSDENIIDVQDNIIKGVSIGETEISIFWSEDEEIAETFKLSVIEEKSTNISYRLYKSNDEGKTKHYKDFVAYSYEDTITYGVEKFNNSELVKDEVFKFSIIDLESGNDVLIEEELDMCIKLKAKSFKVGKSYFMEAVSCENNERLSIDFRAKGLW